MEIWAHPSQPPTPALDNLFNVTCTRSRPWYAADPTVPIHIILYTRTKPLGQLQKRLQLFQQHLVITFLTFTFSNDLLGIELGVKSSSFKVLFSCTLFFGGSCLVFCHLFLDDFHAFEPEGAAFEFDGGSAWGMLIAVGISGVVVLVGEGVRAVQVLN